MGGGKPQASFPRQAGDLQLPGLHLHLRKVAARQVPDQAEVSTRPHASEAASHQAGTATAHAPVNPHAREMAEAGCPRLLQLSRGADEPAHSRGLPGRDHPKMATVTKPPQPKGCPQLDANEVACRRLAPKTRCPSPLAPAALRRHPPEVGAVCGKAARTVLCGGRSAMSVPTATAPDTHRHGCRGAR